MEVNSLLAFTLAVGMCAAAVGQELSNIVNADGKDPRGIQLVAGPVRFDPPTPELAWIGYAVPCADNRSHIGCDKWRERSDCFGALDVRMPTRAVRRRRQHAPRGVRRLV
ncbi:MAG: hypothetical protein M2R45_05160 [Verrucomicrobia subdivision 3 bacterium]|nr:hypothetical protein [Limisphaerales bacterium]